MATPYLGQPLELLPDTEIDQSYIVVRLDPDGSRRILVHTSIRPGIMFGQIMLLAFETDSLDIRHVLWGPNSGSPPTLQH